MTKRSFLNGGHWRVMLYMSFRGGQLVKLSHQDIGSLCRNKHWRFLRLRRFRRHVHAGWSLYSFKIDSWCHCGECVDVHSREFSEKRAGHLLDVTSSLLSRTRIRLTSTSVRHRVSPSFHPGNTARIAEANSEVGVPETTKLRRLRALSEVNRNRTPPTLTQ